jgi:hypothetical protein
MNQPMSSPRLSDRINAARRSYVVGRAPELDLFKTALAETEFPFYVLYLYGPGGIGKTTLLREFTHQCKDAGIRCLYLDGRNIEPSPAAFSNAIQAAIDLEPGASEAQGSSPVDRLNALPSRTVLLFDTYEALAPLDRWISESFLPQLPEHVLVVLAGRNAPSASWRSDPGWQTIIRTVALRNLSPEESRAYLVKRSIPVEQHQVVLDFTHGHPLALSLVADVFAQHGRLDFHPEESPHVISTLIEQFVQQVPGPTHRAALEVCALARTTGEPLLAELLSIPDAHELFDWLRHLSFIESGREGLFPHDLARESLATDLRWRNPDWYAELHKRARAYYNRRLLETHHQEQQKLLFDFVYLHRENPMVKPYVEWQASGSALPETLSPRDVPALLEMVAGHEGQESASIAAYWFNRQPQGVIIWRDATGSPAGFLDIVSLHEASPEDLQKDPAARAAVEFLSRKAPLRPGEVASLFRFWMDRETYQAVSPIQSLAFIQMVRHYLTTPNLAYTFLPCADPDFWSPVLSYASLTRLDQADFSIAGHTYATYGNDWRKLTPVVWLARLAETETATAPVAIQPSEMNEPVFVLSRPDFAAAVRESLRDYTRHNLLHGSPLLRSRLVLENIDPDAGINQRVEVLRARICAAADMLKTHPREQKLYQAVYNTYIHPAPTQEAAAELLDLPFSTYRRHLKSGIERVTDLLWQWEVSGSEK